MPAEVRLGQPLTYTLKVTNLTGIEVQDVVLTEQLPPTFRAQNMEPSATRSEARQAVWEWKKLAPRESKSITVTGLPEAVGEINCCALVTFSTVMCATTVIVQPELALVKTAPPDVLLCDPIPLQLVVRNSGSGVARNVSC